MKFGVVVLLLAVLAACGVSGVNGQSRPNYWEKKPCGKFTLREKKGKIKAAVAKLKSGSCTTVEVPQFYRAKLSVIPLKVSDADASCSGDIALVRTGTSYTDAATTELGKTCMSGKDVYLMDPATAPDYGRTAGIYTRSADKTVDWYNVVIEAVACDPNDTPGCEQPPTRKPTEAPTGRPSKAPTAKPTKKPTASPTDSPTDSPTRKPTKAPTESPTARPTKKPTSKPTLKPSNLPTRAPTSRPTLPCELLNAKFSEARTISIADLRDVDAECWKVSIPSEKGYDKNGAFLNILLDVNFADPTSNCERESVLIMDGKEGGSPMGDPACQGTGLIYNTLEDSAAIRINKAIDSFGPGFTVTIQAMEATKRVASTVCKSEKCVRDAMEQASMNGHSDSLGPSKKGGRKRSIKYKRNENVTLIEIDADLIQLNAPLVVSATSTVTIRPKAPRTSVTLDGGKNIPLIVTGTDSHVEIHKIHFTRGFATQGSGGAISAGGSIDVQDCSFIDNFSSSGGGAIGFKGGVGKSSIKRSFFSGNAALEGDGGAIHMARHKLELEENSFSRNECSGEGSVAYVKLAELTLDSASTYQDNRGEGVFTSVGTVFNLAN